MSNDKLHPLDDDNIDWPDTDGIAHSALQEALSSGLSHDVFRRHMLSVMFQTAGAMRRALADHEVKKSSLEDLGDAISKALDDHPAHDVLSILTGAFVSLTVEFVRRKGHDVTKSITVDGGERRDVTIHALKDEKQAGPVEPPLLGRWHHGQGFIYSGNMRIMRADFDTGPSEEFQRELFDWVCSTLTAAQVARAALAEQAATVPAHSFDRMAELNESNAARILELESEVETLEGENEELKHAPWPEWTKQVLRIVREASGYDGYDDSDGVDLPAEVQELADEYARAAKNVADLRDEVKALRKQAEQAEKAQPVAFDLTEARAIVTDAIRRMRARKVDCHDLTLKAEDFLRATHAAAKPDELWDQTLRERDRYHEVADSLALAIAAHLDVDIGEHSNVNCPWVRALEELAAAKANTHEQMAVEQITQCWGEAQGTQHGYEPFARAIERKCAERWAIALAAAPEQDQAAAR